VVAAFLRTVFGFVPDDLALCPADACFVSTITLSCELFSGPGLIYLVIWFFGAHEASE
jgi:hypothetical protein